MVGRSPELTKARERRFIVPRLTEGGTDAESLFFFLPLASTPTNTHLAEEHRQRPDRAREGTPVGETGNAAAAATQYRAPLKIGLERSRSTARIASETRAQEPVREGRATRHTSANPLPARREEGRTDHTRWAERNARGGNDGAPTRLTGAPTNHSGECGGAFTRLGPDRPHPCLPHTTHKRWGGQTRGPLAEREERPPFAMNVRPSPGAA